MTRLFVGPIVGEFGHELMFVGVARQRALDYEEVTVCTRPTSHALYRDFATEFTPHDFDCEGMVMGTTPETRIPFAAMEAFVPLGCDVCPGREYRVGTPAKFIRYGQRDSGYRDAVVLHARSRGHVPMRNWPQKHWHRLARRLLREGVSRVVCVGLRSQAMLAEGAEDLRDAPLEAQMDVLASARFALGPSSGPMHLAQHCGEPPCPVVVWCGGGPHERRTTQSRYQEHWNPHKGRAWAYQHASWQPSYETVEAWALRALEETHGGQDRH